MSLDPETFIIEAEKACSGLLYMSESDYELKPFYWKGTVSKPVSEAAVLDLTGFPQESTVEIEGLDYFFRNSIKDQYWHGSKQKDDVERFRSLLKLLKDNLTEIAVFRIGAVEIDVYIVGRLQSGELAGISTKVVET